MTDICHLCETLQIDHLEEPKELYKNNYTCRRCGHIYIKDSESIAFSALPEIKKQTLSAWFRNEYERRGKVPYLKEPLSLEDAEKIVEQHPLPDPLEKIDNTMIILERLTKHVGFTIKIAKEYDFPLYYCINHMELDAILSQLDKEKYIETEDYRNPCEGLRITANGFRRLREIIYPGKNSRQCFVAMWFNNEMTEIYESTIKPAIEYKEEGASKPRFKALKINDQEHINDINDEIIAQIRRSKFVVCDLTGYRGGVYFEAGFAYGLGLPIIYTCRGDWAKEELLYDTNDRPVETLFTKSKASIKIMKEGVHFDLAHRNRLQWDPSPDGLSKFQEDLTNRIKAVIV